MFNDGIQEVRRIRQQISEECEHDLDKVLAYYRRIEQALCASGRYRFEEPPTGEVISSEQETESS